MESVNEDNSELSPKEVFLKFLMEIAKDFAFINKTSLTKINDLSSRLLWESYNDKLEKVAVNISNLLKKNIVNYLDIICKLDERVNAQKSDLGEAPKHVSECKTYVLKRFVDTFETDIKQLLEAKESALAQASVKQQVKSEVCEEEESVKVENSENSENASAIRATIVEKEKGRLGLSLIRNNGDDDDEESSDNMLLGCTANSIRKASNKAINNDDQRLQEDDEENGSESASIKVDPSINAASTDKNPELVFDLPNVTNRRESDSPDSSQSLVFDINNITYRKIDVESEIDEKVNVEETEETSTVVDANNEEIESKIDNGDLLNNNNNNEQAKDELLCLLREVELPQHGNGENDNDGEFSKNFGVPKASKKREKELLEWLKEWVEKDDSISESDDISEFSLSSFNFSESDEEQEKEKEDPIQNEEIEIEDKFPIDVDRLKEMEKMYEIKDFNVKIIDFLKYNYTYDDDFPKKCRKRTLSDEVDRLCNLNLVKKARTLASPSKGVTKVYKNKRKGQRRTSGTTSDSETETTLSNFSESEDEVIVDKHHADENKDEPVDQNELLAKSLCNNIRDSSSESDIEMSDLDISNISDSSSNRSGQSGKKAKKDSNATKESKADKRKLTEEEKQRKRWRKDPLLCGKLDESDTSSDESTIQTKRKNNYNLIKSSSESERNIHSDKEQSSLSNQTTNDNIDKIEIVNKSNSKTFNLNKLLDSDSNSDVEFVLPEKEIDSIDISDDENVAAGSKRGRRNIRALLSEECLTESTQKAKSEEMERISRLETIARQRESQSSFSDPDTLILDPNPPTVKVHSKLTRRLKQHQKEGVLFMWLSCFESLAQMKESPGSGCILAHCMGLGKTLQVITLLHTLFKNRHIAMKHAVVVCPLSTVQNWKKEFNKAFKDFFKYPINVFTIGNRKEILTKLTIVRDWRTKGGTLILSYETFQTLVNETKLEKYTETTKKVILEALIDPGPELIVCDEGHLIRNENSLRAKALNRVKTRRRIVLTGTPLQNNLIEYYQMVQFVKPNLLGNSREFRTNFVNPITNGQYDDSTPADIKYMKRRTHVLYQLLENTVQRYESSELAQYLPKMIDYALFIKLSALQKILYQRYMEIANTQAGSSIQRKQFFKDYRTIYAICSHPYTMQKIEDRNKNPQTRRVVEKDVINLDPDEEVEQNMENEWWKTFMYCDVATRFEYSYKFVVMRSIIEEAETIGDKVLLFSQSLAEMDAIEHFLQNHGTSKCPTWTPNTDYCRMDGTVPPEERTIMCDNFNNTKKNPLLRLFIMSHKVGGLGLNLVAANRVILMGVNFNPSYESQSIYRAYRFGQSKIVYIYRLIAMGSMEEKVYHRCVTKLAVSSRVVDKLQIARHYKSIELQEMYKYDFNYVDSPLLAVPEDILLGKLLYRMNCIVKYHEHQGLLQNRPDECLDEEEKVAAWEEFNRINQPPAQAENQPENVEKMDFNLATNVPQNIQTMQSVPAPNRDPLEIDNDPLDVPTPWTSAANNDFNAPDFNQQLLDKIRKEMSTNFNSKKKRNGNLTANSAMVQNDLVLDEDDVIISETASEVASTQSSIIIPNLNGINTEAAISNSDIITID